MFKVGDRVSSPYGNGVVVVVREVTLGLMIDDAPDGTRYRGHTMYGMCPLGNGWFVDIHVCRLLEKRPRILKGYAKFARENYALSSG